MTGRRRPPPRPRCPECGIPLHHRLVAAGETIHPTCDPADRHLYASKRPGTLNPAVGIQERSQP